LHDTYGRLAAVFIENNSLSMISRIKMIFPYIERSLSLLNPWLIQLDPDASNRVDSRDDRRINCLLNELFNTEQNMAAITMARHELVIAEGHCERSLAYSRRYGLEGEEKTTNILVALRTYCDLRQIQCDYSGAVLFAEEAYNLVVEAYNCVHPQVQEAAGVLINILIAKGDLFDAERYAQVTYGNLRDEKNGIDQDSEVVARGAYNLADVILRQEGDLMKAEELARESLRIRILMNDGEYCRIDVSYGLLACIFQAQGNFGDETKELYERSWAITIRNVGPDGLNTAVGNFNIGTFYHNSATKQSTVELGRTQLLLAKSHCVEAQRIWSKIYGPTHPNTFDVSTRLTDNLSELSQL
jgi:hypothetical protein